MTAGGHTEKESLLRLTARRIGRRWLSWRFRNFDPDSEPLREARVAGLSLQVLPDVFNPALHFTSSFFSRYLRRPGVVAPGSRVLDIGTGSGVLAISAALAGAGRVAAVDINPAAVECARLNAQRRGLENRIEVLLGDMFEPVKSGKFDMVVCNPPYLRGEPQSIAGYAYWGGPNLEWLERFGQELHDHLAPDGCCILSIGDAAEVVGITQLLTDCGWRVDEAARRDMLFEIIYLFRLSRAAGASVVEKPAQPVSPV